MDASTRARRYDLFKLIVAILLLILFFLLLSRPTPQALIASPTASSTVEANPINVTATETALSPTASGTPLPVSSPTRTTESLLTMSPSPTATNIDTSTLPPALSPTQTIESLSIISPSPTGTNTFTPTLTSLPPPSPTQTVELLPTTSPSPSATPLPSPNGTAAVEPSPAATSRPPGAMTACDAAASRSRLQSGTNVTILHRLNFRSSPGIRDNWLRTNMPGTHVEVIGGPECVPHLWGAYMWWQIRLPDGQIGWSAEGSIHGTFYFMEPIP